MQEPGRPGHPLVAPLQVLLRRGRKQQEQAGGVGAVFGNHVFRVHHVALGFGHLGPVFQDHALGEEALERLVDLDHPQVPEDLGEKAGVQQVQHRVFDAADVLVHGQPVVHPGRVQDASGVVGAGVAQEVPGGLHEGVHGVHFPPGRAVADGAGHLIERRQLRQGGAALPGDGDFQGQHHREIACRHRRQAASARNK